MFEASIIANDISKSIQRYQFTLQQARQKLDLAIALGCWLLPSNLLINNTTITGYNNKLQKSTTDLRLGINDNINTDLIKSTTDNNSNPKVKLPHQITDNKQPDKPNKKDTSDNFKPDKPNIKPTPSSKSHETNLAVITVGVSGLAWYMFR